MNWHRLWQEPISVAQRVQCGDKRSEWIEELGAVVLAMVVETPDITLAKIAGRRRGHGEHSAPSKLHRFF